MRRSRALPALLVAVFVALVAAACTARDTVAVRGGAVDESLEAFCDGGGAPVLADGTCTGQLAESLFRHAVCGCGGLDFNGDLVADAFDSRVVDGPGRANVASNVSLSGNGSMDISGNVVIGGPDGVRANELLHVAGDLISAGSLGRPGSAIEVEGAAWIGGDIMVESLTVSALTVREGVSIEGDVMAGTTEIADFEVPQPCRCEEAVDVAERLAVHQQINHNAERGLDPAHLSRVDGDADLPLQCGRFYLDEISGDGAGRITIRVVGRSALFVGGNITTQQDLDIEIGPDGELDLFVGGNIQVSGVSTLGDPSRPRLLRIYVAAGGSIALSAGSVLAGNLYAPLADLASSAPLELYGAVVVSRVNGAASIDVHHDLAIADASETCDD
jgi:hypothetical protein